MIQYLYFEVLKFPLIKQHDLATSTLDDEISGFVNSNPFPLRAFSKQYSWRSQ